MKTKYRIINAIKGNVMKPLYNIMRSWEISVTQREGALQGAPNSPSRFDIIGNALKSKGEHAPMPGFPHTGVHVFGSIRNIRKSIRDLNRNPLDGKKQIDAETLENLIAYAQSVGASTIGFTDVKDEWIFQETAIAYRHAIVLTMEMDKERMQMAPSPETAINVHQTYNQLGQVANKVADWLREHGYAAHAGHPLNGMALYPPMGQSAGLGSRGFHGLLITPEYGPRVRIAAVFTEIENLPVYEGDKHDWVLDFCDMCRRCIRDCPAEAIYNTPVEHDNGIVTTVDNTKCFPMFLEQHGCSVCIKVCPFNNQSYSHLQETFQKQRSKQNLEAI